MTEWPRAGVDGTHRASRRWPAWLWVGFAATQALLLVTSWDSPGWAVWLHVLGTATGLTLAWMLWSQRTVVAPRGLRVKAEWRWRALPWDQVRSVDAPSRWHPTQVLSVTTIEGDVIATHVPAGLHQDLVADAAEHRSSRPPTAGRT